MTTKFNNQAITEWLRASDASTIGTEGDNVEGRDMDTAISRYAEVSRISAALDVAGQSTSTRILSALGHPGYGEKYAEIVLREWQENPDRSLHAIVYMEEGT